MKAHPCLEKSYFQTQVPEENIQTFPYISAYLVTDENISKSGNLFLLSKFGHIFPLVGRDAQMVENSDKNLSQNEEALLCSVWGKKFLVFVLVVLFQDVERRKESKEGKDLEKIQKGSVRLRLWGRAGLGRNSQGSRVSEKTFKNMQA